MTEDHVPPGGSFGLVLHDEEPTFPAVFIEVVIDARNLNFVYVLSRVIFPFLQRSFEGACLGFGCCGRVCSRGGVDRLYFTDYMFKRLSHHLQQTRNRIQSDSTGIIVQQALIVEVPSHSLSSWLHASIVLQGMRDLLVSKTKLLGV